MNLCVVVTTHADYLGWLSGALRSIGAQRPAFAEKLVVFDGCAPVNLPDGWRTVQGHWGNPAEARNAGMTATTAPWIIFWDADNVMPSGYVAAMVAAIARAADDVAILYPDLHYCDENLRPIRFSRQGEWSYWSMRMDNCVDTASAWRRVAIDLAGGWHDRGDVEDFALALELTENGWIAAHVDGPPVLMREHARSRMATALREQRLGRAMWRSMSLAVVTPFAGRRGSLQRWSSFFDRNELPERTTAYMVDDSGSAAFRQRLLRAAGSLLNRTALNRAELVRHPQNRVAAASRHRHVAALYAAAVAHVREDLLLTFEDDVVPPHGGALALADELLDPYEGRRGAVGGVYPMREVRGAACAGLGSATGWGESPRLRTLPRTPIDVAYLGGGFTLWANWALQGTPITLDPSRELGWDALLCERLRQRGFRVRLHGGIRCRHLTGSARITKDYPWPTSGW